MPPADHVAVVQLSDGRVLISQSGGCEADLRAAAAAAGLRPQDIDVCSIPENEVLSMLERQVSPPADPHRDALLAVVRWAAEQPTATPEVIAAAAALDDG